MIDTTEQDLAVFMGKKPEPVEQPDQVFEIFDENIEAVFTFGRLTTQWNVSMNGERTGLNYTALKVVMDMTEVKDQKDCFNKVRIMEKRALEILAGDHGTTTQV